MSSLADIVEVERRFARSARVDSDLNGTPPLTGYVLQPSVRKALDTMVTALAEDGQPGFTWTGPYGGGKSCAALLVGNLVAGRPQQRARAREIVGASLARKFDAAFPGKQWRVVALTGRRALLRTELARAAAEALGWDDARHAAAAEDDRALCSFLREEAAKTGVLLLVDELGKFFEHAATDGGDIHLLQDLAETAARSDRKLVMVGVLHQSFAQYAGRLTRAARDEWTKIQGRFLDIPFAAGPDEVAALLARAIKVKGGSRSEPIAARLAKEIGSRRAVDEQALTSTLAGAWPLHPATALILGPVSRQRFAQNERSVFGFLTSAEPFGFQDYLRNTTIDDAGAGYAPDRLWDYLIANFGLELTAGPDGGRVSLAIEAIERAAVRGDDHARIAKIAALIELFRNGSGLAVCDAVLSACAPDLSPPALQAILTELVDRAVLMRQPRLGGYALFAGTDFDLEEALKAHRDRLSASDVADLPKQLGIGPVAAKRHYFEKGALRTFDVVLQIVESDEAADEWAEQVVRTHGRRNAAGLIMVLLPEADASGGNLSRAAKRLASAFSDAGAVAAVGAAKRVYLLREHVVELFALSRVEAAHPQLEGDRIARRELAARRSEVLDAIRHELLEAIGAAAWWTAEGRTAALDGRPLAVIASEVADAAFPAAPVLHSELLYRDRPSSSAMAASRGLAHAMVADAEKEELGFKNFPAELGLYLTVLKPFGLHRSGPDGSWRFGDPSNKGAGATLWPAWRVLKDEAKFALSEVYATWARRPFGLKRGVMPILALAYLIAHRDRTAVYVDGLYQVVLDDTFVDRMLQAPGSVEVRSISRSAQDGAFLGRLAEQLSTPGFPVEAKSLPVAAALFARFRTLPEWSQRTSVLSERTRKVRDSVVKAQDPEDLLFVQLPSVLQGVNDRVATIMAAVQECEAAYPAMLQRLRDALALRLDVDPQTFDGLGLRAATVAGVTADLRFDAFAMRVGEFAAGGGDIEGLASLLVHKPPRGWTDREHDQALFELAKLCQRFREAEAMAELKGREPTAQAISMMVGLDPKATPLLRAFHVSDRELATADALAESLLQRLRSQATSENVELAVLARLFQRLQPSERELVE